MSNNFKTRSSLPSDDLEIDCAPYVKPEYSHSVRNVLDFFEKNDSGIASYDSGFMSADKIGHYSYGGDGTVATGDEQTLDLNQKLEDLNLCETEDEPKSDKKFDSGFDPVRENSISSDCDVFHLYNQDADGDSQLHMAIINLFAPIALFIIGKAPHPEWLNTPNNLLQTPLHLAVMMKMPLVIQKLVESGADINTRDYKGDTPLHIACREGFNDILEILLHPIRHKMLSGNVYDFPQINRQQTLEARNYNGQSCLHLAAEGTHLPCIQLLIKQGANMNAQDGKSGRTVLHYAAESGNILLLKFLLQYSAVNIHCRTYAGLTPTMLAYGRGFSDAVIRLQQSGGQIEQNYSEETDSDDEMS